MVGSSNRSNERVITVEFEDIVSPGLAWMARARRLRQFCRVVTLLMAGAAVLLLAYHVNTGSSWSFRSWWNDLASLWCTPFLFVIAFALRAFVPAPSALLFVIGGLLFGTLGGLVWGVFGAIASALVLYALPRLIDADPAGMRLRRRIDLSERMLRQHDTVGLALASALPIAPLAPMQIAAGRLGMPLTSFVGATVMGIVPRAALYALLGSAFAVGDPASVAITGCVLGGIAMLAQRYQSAVEQLFNR